MLHICIILPKRCGYINLGKNGETGTVKYELRVEWQHTEDERCAEYGRQSKRFFRFLNQLNYIMNNDFFRLNNWPRIIFNSSSECGFFTFRTVAINVQSVTAPHYYRTFRLSRCFYSFAVSRFCCCWLWFSNSIIWCTFHELKTLKYFFFSQPKPLVIDAWNNRKWANWTNV